MEEEELQGEMLYKKKGEHEWEIGFATLIDDQLSIFNADEKKKWSKLSQGNLFELAKEDPKDVELYPESVRKDRKARRRLVKSSSFDLPVDSPTNTEFRKTMFVESTFVFDETNKEKETSKEETKNEEQKEEKKEERRKEKRKDDEEHVESPKSPFFEKRSQSADVFRKRSKSEFFSPNQLPSIAKGPIQTQSEQSQNPEVKLLLKLKGCRVLNLPDVEDPDSCFVLETENEEIYVFQPIDKEQGGRWAEEIRFRTLEAMDEDDAMSDTDQTRASHCIPHRFANESMFLKKCHYCHRLITEFKGFRCIHCNEHFHAKCGKNVPPNCGLSLFKKAVQEFQSQKGDKRTIKKFTDSLNVRLKNKGETLFGVDLEKVPMSEDGLPAILTMCINAVEKRGMDCVGIYRVSGVKSDVERLKLYFSFGRPNLSDDDQWADINVVTGALKSWFREMPKPLLTNELFSDFIAVAKDGKSHIDKDELYRVTHFLPPKNYAVLKYLIAHLKRVAANSEVNKMQPENLGAIFGPNLLRHNEQDGSSLLNQQNSVILHMILNYNYIFER